MNMLSEAFALQETIEHTNDEDIKKAKHQEALLIFEQHYNKDELDSSTKKSIKLLMKYHKMKLDEFDGKFYHSPIIISKPKLKARKKDLKRKNQCLNFKN